MTETGYWFGDSRVRRLSARKEPSPEAFIVYHGFPGEPAPADAGKCRPLPKKCVDVARALHEATGADVYLPQYEGLGESMGKFGFMNSVIRGARFEREVADAGHKRVHVVGNSWGGLVGYNAYRGIPEKRGLLILISPLLDLPDEAWVRSFLPYYVRSYPRILGADTDALERAVRDLERVRGRANPMAFAAEDRLLAPRALIVHGTRDEAVPVEWARRFVKLFPASLVELDADHSYSADRAPMIAAVLDFVRKRGGR